MDRICKQIQAGSSNAKDLKDLHDHLKKLESLGRNGKEVDTGLMQLDPKEHTLGFIFLLHQRCGYSMDEGSLEFMNRCQQLFLVGNKQQARMELKRLTRIIHKYTAVCCEMQVPLRAVVPLEKAAALVATEEHQLTPAHADWLQVCLLSKSYARAGRLLGDAQRLMLQISDNRATGFSQADYLRFWYYGGLVFTGLKDFGRAIDYFETCFSAPALGLSAPALEAYKKHALVSLIHRGQCDPRRSPPALMMRQLKAMCAAYVDFANAFATKDTAVVQELATQHHETYVKDGNFGLVQQCIDALARQQIRGLTQTYLTLNLDTLAKDANLPSKDAARKKLLGMIEAGSIVATINEQTGMVSFGEANDEYDDMRTLAALDEQVRESIRMGSLLKQLDDQIATSADFIQKARQAENRGFGAGGPGGIGDEGFGMGGFDGGGGFI